MRTYGPRFSGGYQFPRTHSAPLKREKPIAREVVDGVGVVEVVPLTGGRQRQWDVCAVWTDRAGDGKASTYIAKDELEARLEFRKLIGELRRDAPSPA